MSFNGVCVRVLVVPKSKMIGSGTNSKVRLIGTPLPDVNLTKPNDQLTRRERKEIEVITTPWENQSVTDERGRAIRFHGAFTGGWSAGYHNTIGSKEGFTPVTYVSSRQNRSSLPVNTIESIMDEEDRAHFSQKKYSRLKTQDIYTNSYENKNFNYGTEFFSLPEKNSIGKKLLTRLLGSKAESVCFFDEAVDSKVIGANQVGKTYGLDYNPNKLTHGQTIRTSRGNTIGMTTQFEDLDEWDPVNSELVLDRTEASNLGDKNRIHRSDGKGEFPGFVSSNGPLAASQIEILEKYVPPVLPKNFDAYHKMEPSILSMIDFSGMTAEIRGTLLGEIGKKKQEEILPPRCDKLDSDDCNLPKSTDVYRYDKEKQRRFENWSNNKQNVVQVDLTPTEKRKEYSEFLSADSSRFRPLSQSLANSFESSSLPNSSITQENSNSNETKIIITREIEEWAPSKLLCKRMGVMNPIRTMSGNEARCKKGQGDVFAGNEGGFERIRKNFTEKLQNDRLVKRFVTNSGDEEENDDESSCDSESLLLSIPYLNNTTDDDDDEVVVDPLSQRSSMDLFKAIFEDSPSVLENVPPPAHIATISQKQPPSSPQQKPLPQRASHVTIAKRKVFSSLKDEDDSDDNEEMPQFDLNVQIKRSSFFISN